MTTFHQLASARPRKQLFFDGDTTLTYGELVDRIERTVALIQNSGLGSGDRVVVASEDNAAFAPLFFALVDMGIAVVFGDPGMTPSEFDKLCSLLEPKGCVMDDALIKRLGAMDRGFSLCLPIKAKASGGGLLGKLFGKKKRATSAPANAYPAVLDECKPAAPSGASEDDVAYIIMTSGSTSQPKAVPATRKALFTHLDTLTRHFGYDGSSRIMNLLPLFHADGSIQGPALACVAGGTWVRPFAFSLQNIEPMLHGIYSRRVTHFIGVPTILSLVQRMSANLEESFATDDFKFVVSAAGKLETELWQSFERTFKTRVCNLFGLSETITGSLFSGPDDDSHRPGTIGKPFEAEVKIVDAEGAEVKAGETGELLLRGDHVFSGYISDDPAVNEGLFMDGWLKTGDLAHRDAEGFYFIDGRIKNVVISGGENIYPEEITEVLSEHPGVAAAVCFGLPHGEWGEILVALVERSDVALDENDVIGWARERLSAYKVPKEVGFTAELPYGPSGKVRLKDAREIFEGLRAASVVDGGNVVERVTAIAASTFKQPDTSLSPGSGPHNTPGWDSLAHISFVVALEAAFSIKIATGQIMAMQSLDDASTIVSEQLGKSA